MDLRQQFEHYEETGSLNYESGLGAYGAISVGIDAMADEADYDNAIATFESAITDLTDAEKSLNIITNIEEYCDIAKNSVDNGTATFETAVALSANIEKELAKGNLDITYFIGDEAPTFESASNQPVTVINKLVDVFGKESDSDEEATFESAMDKIKEKARVAGNYAKEKAIKFKEWVVKLAKRAWEIIKDAGTFVANLFRKNSTIIDSLIAEANTLSDTLVKDKKLTGKDFLATFPYLKKHTGNEYKALIASWEDSGNKLIEFGVGVTGKITSSASVSEISIPVANIYQFSTIPGFEETDKDLRGIILNYVGKKVKILSAGENVASLAISEINSGTISETANITPISVKDAISVLTTLKRASEKAEKVVKNLPKAINAVKGTVVKDSAAMKSVTTISNAITTYAKSSGGMTTATIKAMSKHLKMYTKKIATTEA